MPVYCVKVSEILSDFLKDKMLYGAVLDTHYERSVYIFFSVAYPGSRMEKYGSGIRDKHPGSA
jgi:hypothetical protein